MEIHRCKKGDYFGGKNYSNKMLHDVFELASIHFQCYGNAMNILKNPCWPKQFRVI